MHRFADQFAGRHWQEPSVTRTALFLAALVIVGVGCSASRATAPYLCLCWPCRHASFPEAPPNATAIQAQARTRRCLRQFIGSECSCSVTWSAALEDEKTCHCALRWRTASSAGWSFLEDLGNEPALRLAVRNRIPDARCEDHLFSLFIGLPQGRIASEPLAKPDQLLVLLRA